MERKKIVYYHPIYPNTVIGIIKRNPNFETFYVLASNTYNEDGKSWASILDSLDTGYTIFAPTNAALQNLLSQLQVNGEIKVGSLEEILNDSQSERKLSQLVAYHIVVAIFPAFSLRGDNLKLKTYAENMKLPVTIQGDDIFILGTPIQYIPIGGYLTRSGPEEARMNGLVYQIDKVFVPFITNKRIESIDEVKKPEPCIIL